MRKGVSAADYLLIDMSIGRDTIGLHAEKVELEAGQLEKSTGLDGGAERRSLRRWSPSDEIREAVHSFLRSYTVFCEVFLPATSSPAAVLDGLAREVDDLAA